MVNLCWLFGNGWAGTMFTAGGPDPWLQVSAEWPEEAKGWAPGYGRLCLGCGPSTLAPPGATGVTATTPHQELRPPPPACSSVCRGAGQLRPVCCFLPQGADPFQGT